MSATTRKLIQHAGVIVAVIGFTSQSRAQQPPTSPDNPAGVSASDPGVAPAESVPAPGFVGALWTRSKLSGDWFGARGELRDNGVTFDLSSALFYQGVASGGLRDEFAFGGRNDYRMHVDGEKAGLWKGLLIDLHAETVYGDSVNRDTGALSPVNIGRTVPIPQGSTTALTGVKVTQALSENFALFAGKINTLDGFSQPFLPGSVLDSGFLNMNWVYNLVEARTVPYSTLGAGAALLVHGQPAAVVMVLDTNNTPTTSGFSTFFDNGCTILAQGGCRSPFSRSRDSSSWGEPTAPGATPRPTPSRTRSSRTWRKGCPW
jgi:porin